MKRKVQLGIDKIWKSTYNYGKYYHSKEGRNDQMDKKKLGTIGEGMAAAILQAKGYAVLARNWYCRSGEIDIVAMRGREVIFLEVKTRTNMQYGTPAEAVTPSKRRHMQQAARYYLKRYGMEHSPWRCDVMAIYVDHIENAF